MYPSFSSAACVLILFALCSGVLVGCGPEVTSDPDVLARLPEQVDYNFHIKPLLSDRCFSCHGPDANTREAGLRLDTEEGAYAALEEGGGHAVVPRSLRRSEVFRRITSGDPGYRMPPPESNLTLSEYEKALIARWIEQGADYEPHWAFMPPETPSVPTVAHEAWPRGDLDRLVLARLEREGLTPSPEASNERLLRRVTFDLTGLPPTPEEIDAFLADERPDAYGRVVDRLFSSDAHAERMAMEWMDVARYADSHGYHADGLREMWPWRDWVIGAFRENMPYDRFVTLQLAGDLLPQARREQILATGFNRNHPINSEAGIIDEEYRIENVAERTNTFGRAFLGLTMECARCHDHKFDPVSQKEYYSLFAFFNNVNEVGMSGNDGNAGPNLLLLDKRGEERLAEIRRRIAEQEETLRRRAAQVEEARSSADHAAVGEAPAPTGLVAHYPLDSVSDGRTADVRRRGKSAEVSGDPEVIPGRQGSALRLGGDYKYLELEDVGRFERYEPFSIGLWVYPEGEDDFMFLLGNAGEKNNFWRGYELVLDSLNRVSARLTHAFPDNLLYVTSEASLPLERWTHLLMTYDGSSRAAGLKLYLDGRPAAVETVRDNLYKSIQPVRPKTFEPYNKPIRVGKSVRIGSGASGDDGIFLGAVDDIRIYDRMLTAVEAAQVAGAAPPQDGADWLAHHLETQDGPYREGLQRLERLRREEHALLDTVPEVMVMKEMDRPRRTYVLERGLYDAQGARVQPGTPEHLLPFPEDFPQNRLGLARWLFHRDHPLTARVAVNRYWQMLFGTGLVETAEDFGLQGALPSHPELLDYLAVTFQDSGWDLRALLKRIVLSATYRQTSRAAPALQERDPGNRLLARGPSRRLPAEMIRDNALAAGGLLVKRVGGGSVKPYQPPNLWEEKGEFSHALLTYRQDHGDSLYRRSLYTFIRRTSPPPAMLAFDAPDRNYCVVRRQRTNTPMQALVLLNDPQFVEAARVLAERMQREGGAAVEEQITYAFRLLTGRRPQEEERALLTDLYREERRGFEEAPDDARALLSVGEHPRDERLDPVETAARTIVASMIMNHDDAYTLR